MATETAEAPAAEEAAPAASGGGRAGIVKIAALLLTVMVVQGIATYFLLPSPTAGEDETLAAEARDAAAGDSDEETIEVPIDKFHCTNVLAAEYPIHVSLNVVAIVARRHEFAFDDAANKAFKARVRQVVIEVVRGSSMEELRETGWNTMRRRIREEINKLLRKSYVVDIVFSEYQTQ